jgi:hypothetical protein
VALNMVARRGRKGYGYGYGYGYGDGDGYAPSKDSQREIEKASR